MVKNVELPVFYDVNLNAVFCTYAGLLSTEEFKEIANKQIEIIVTKELKKALNDIKEMKVLKPDIQEWINTVWFPKAQNAGLKYFAFVVPDDIFGKISMEGANKNAVNEFGIEIHYFTSIEKAKSWLISKS